MPVSLQINLAPGDFVYAKHILPHQLKTLAGQVDEVVLTIETKPSKGRFANGWHENRQKLYDFLERELKSQYDVIINPVDYTDVCKHKVAAYFFGTNTIAEKDFRGGPFYAYFYGIYSASHDLVMHLDADILLGGGSPAWVKEAAKLLDTDPKCLFACPLPGPPHPEDRLIDQQDAWQIAPYTYVFNSMSTRIFMTDRRKISECRLNKKKPSLRDQLKAFVEGNPREDLPEHIFSDLMRTEGLTRIDFRGTGQGLWSLHPPFRTKSFYDNLENIIDRIATGDLPESQYGFYDIVDELCDWSQGWADLEKNRWWKRIFRAKYP